MPSNILYIIWLCFPGLYFIIGLWGSLEKLSKTSKRHNPADFYRQGLFLFFGVLGAIAVEALLLRDYIMPYLPDWMPLLFAQIVILPLILLIAARLMGGTKPPSITRQGRLRKN